MFWTEGADTNREGEIEDVRECRIKQEGDQSSCTSIIEYSFKKQPLAS